jgi:hypothetical protein
MLLDQVSDRQMQAAQVMTGLTMAAFVAAPVFGRWARSIRMALACLYIAAAFGSYFTLSCDRRPGVTAGLLISGGLHSVSISTAAAVAVKNGLNIEPHKQEAT